MLVIDPKERPSAQQILQHQFFSIKISDETEAKIVEKGPQMDHRMASKSTEKTMGTTSASSSNLIH